MHVFPFRGGNIQNSINVKTLSGPHLEQIGISQDLHGDQIKLFHAIYIPMKSLRNSYVPDWLPHNAAYI